MQPLLDAMAMLPLAVPGLVMAFGYVAMSLNWPFGGPGAPFRGWFDIVGATPNPVPFLIVAYAVRRLPYVVRAASAGLEQTSGQLEEAALNLGASTFTAIRKIVVPLIIANLIAGAMLTFAFAMLEVSDSLIPCPAGRRISPSPRRSSSFTTAWATAPTSPAPWASGAWRKLADDHAGGGGRVDGQEDGGDAFQGLGKADFE